MYRPNIHKKEYGELPRKYDLICPRLKVIDRLYRMRQIVRITTIHRVAKESQTRFSSENLVNPSSLIKKLLFFKNSPAEIGKIKLCANFTREIEYLNFSFRKPYSDVTQQYRKLTVFNHHFTIIQFPAISHL